MLNYHFETLLHRLLSEEWEFGNLLLLRYLVNYQNWYVIFHHVYNVHTLKV
jgi:hypothetical protein